MQSAFKDKRLPGGRLQDGSEYEVIQGRALLYPDQFSTTIATTNWPPSIPTSPVAVNSVSRVVYPSRL